MAPTPIQASLWTVDCLTGGTMSCLGSGYSTTLPSLPLDSTPEPLAFISDLLQAVQDEPTLCSSCEEGATAASRCRDCSELLCEPCVRAHQRVRLTKDHRIVRFGDDNSPLTGSQASNSPCSSNGGGINCSTTTYCERHHEPQSLYCETCYGAACGDCALKEHRGHQLIYLQDAIEGARAHSMRLANDARAGAQAVQEGLETAQRMVETLEIHARQAATEVRTFTGRLVALMEERERDLLARIDQVRQMKGTALGAHMEGLRMAMARLARTSDALTEAMDSSSNLDLLAANERAASELRQARALRATMGSPEDDTITFVPPEPNVFRALAIMGTIATTVPTRPKPSSLMEAGVEAKAALGRPVHGAPGPVVIRSPRGTPSLVFGQEGEADGQLCRPWGVCCDKLGNIIVADRSNNRIQVFRPDGTFSHKFGSQGTLQGQFDRPAGVAADPMGRIIVADKDNHRIQIFLLDGSFVLSFGEKGCRNGQFNYPWDVAANAKGQIVVSDTRNHRIQLFTSDGIFLNKYGFEGAATMWKHFDSPRGVCFNPAGDVIVTDFNNHRLVVIDPRFLNAQFLGSEGTGIKQFLRPQGIVCDDEGRIVVADSRNNRIQVFEANGTFLWRLGQAGKGPGELDRPSGVCISPDGRIVVVDFGNNRVQLF